MKKFFAILSGHFSVRRLSYGLRCIVSCFCSSVFLCIPDYPLTKPRFFVVPVTPNNSLVYVFCAVI